MGHGASVQKGVCALHRLKPLVAGLMLLLAGCASGPQHGLNDPFEQTNRAIYHFNEKVNGNVTLPIAWVYVNYVPGPVRRGLHNALANVESPIIFANELLQGRAQHAGETLARFVVNSTIGLGGLIDVGAAQGLPPYEADFGQTLALYGVGSGPFLVLPIIGPSTPRDALGTIADLFADPLLYVPADWSLLGRAATVVGTHSLGPFERNAGAILLRKQLGQISVDPYATMRSVYRQQRIREISGAQVPEIPKARN